jgi:hypothetical protein
VRSLDLLIERISRYRNIKITPIKIVKKNKIILKKPSITAIIHRGAPIYLSVFKKSLSMESFTSSGDIHVYR